MKSLATPDLIKLCEKWQQKLGLAHWRIGIKICKRDEMPVEDKLATISFSLENECALISILREEDYPKTFLAVNFIDVEVSLVHKLLHIPLEYFVNIDQDSLESVLEEAFIERTAQLLVDLSRK